MEDGEDGAVLDAAHHDAGSELVCCCASYFYDGYVRAVRRSLWWCAAVASSRTDLAFPHRRRYHGHLQRRASPAPFAFATTHVRSQFAFWAYLLAIRFLSERPTRWKLGSVILAVSGVFVIAYGDSILASHEEGTEVRVAESSGSERLVGNLLALFGSISYA